MIDIGDGVACLEFHSKMNSLGGDTVQMLKYAVDEVEKNHVGLVIGNQGGNFSAGANIMMILLAAQEEEWDDIEYGCASIANGGDASALFGKTRRHRAVWFNARRRLRNFDARQ